MTGDIAIPSSAVVVSTFCDAYSIYTGVVLQMLVCMCVCLLAKLVHEQRVSKQMRSVGIGSRDEEASVDLGHAI